MFQSNPAVSVIINCHNSERYLAAAIDSVLSQTFVDWEIILWDNASTDQTPAIAKSYKQVKYYRSNVKESLGEARNRALDEANGDFIAFLDSDDLWLPSKLEKQIPLFSDPRVGLVFSDSMFFNDKGNLKRAYENSPYFTGQCFKELLSRYFLSMETVVLRTTALKEQPYYFDPAYNMIEEADLFRRIALNWKLEMVPEVLAKWRVHENSFTFKNPLALPRETNLMLIKYAREIPNFNLQYRDEIEKIKLENNVCEAKYHWAQGQGRLARKILFKQLFHPKSLVFFACSYFPKNWVDRVLINFFKRGIT